MDDLRSAFSKKSIGGKINQLLEWAAEIREGNLTSVADVDMILHSEEKIVRIIAVQMVLPDLIRADINRGIGIVQALMKENDATIIEHITKSVYPLLFDPSIAQKLIEGFQPKTATPVLPRNALTL